MKVFRNLETGNVLRKEALLIYTVLIAASTSVFDYNRLVADFNRLYELLTQARLDAIYTKAKIFVKFDGDLVTVTNEPPSKILTAAIQTLAVLAYDTTLGGRHDRF